MGPELSVQCTCPHDRVEAYNPTSSFRASNPNSHVGNRNFWLIRGMASDDLRIFEFVLKLGF